MRRASVTVVTAVIVALGLAGCTAASQTHHPPTTETSAGGFAVSTLWQQYAPVPNGASAGSAVLGAVACASAHACFAIGQAESTVSSSDNPRIPVLDGMTQSGWSAEKAPFPGAHGVWNQISCVTGFCAALGDRDLPGGETVPVADVFDHGRWRATTLPSLPKSFLDPSTNQLDCASDHTCLGIIDGSSAGDAQLTEVLQFGPSGWAAEPLPVPANASAARANVGVTDVGCASVHTCIAVGGYWGDGMSENLLDVFSDGRSKTITSSVDSFDGTSCTAVDCMVLTSPGIGSQVSVVDGTAPLSVQYALSSPTPIDDLNCPTAGWCAASIAPNNSSYSIDQLATRSQNRWTPVNVAPAGRTGQLLTLIQCSTSGVCIAGGGYSRHAHSKYTLPLVDTLDHGQWSPHTIALPPGTRSKGATIDAIACPAALRCVAIGDIGDSIHTI